jgi:hypothetical protein
MNEIDFLKQINSMLSEEDDFWNINCFYVFKVQELINERIENLKFN